VMPFARKWSWSPRRASRRRLVVEGLANPTPREVTRPSTRADCLAGGSNAERPCPFVSCRHHLALEVRKTGSIIFTFAEDTDLEQLPQTCALDVADQGAHTLEEVGALLNVSRERIRQLEHIALSAIPEEARRELQESNT
jgi:hypothetical protein